MGTVLATKITLLGPAPFGGTLTAVIDDPHVAGWMTNGWTVYRIWRVIAGSLGGLFTDEIYHA